ncbi:tail fiber domain-containing protein [Salmonella enterica subsp. enterica]|nr:tail fiber domain-containing protein [Salmonella enterica subsp. enterica]
MPPIDDRTTRLDLPKPAQPNTLRNDVQRLRDTIDKLDAKVATLDANGALESAQIPADVARLDATSKLEQSQLPANVVTKDASGKIDSSLLKDDVVTNIWDVASEVLMLDLTQASVGDIANFPQSGRTFKLMRMPPTERANWKEQVATAVTSVNGRMGDVVVAEPGVNADITQLTKLSGPLTLGGDGASDNDAVTMRQLKGAMGTSGGASMTGVMNNFIGAVEWFNGVRGSWPAGYIPADGKEYDRADYPDLWAAIDKGMFQKVTDAQWLNGPGGVPKGQYRGMYSTGNGTTTFRVPDLNGVQPDSTRALFLRGDAGGQSTLTIGGVGEVLGSAAPNIQGNIGLHGTQTKNGGTVVAGVSGQGVLGEGLQDGFASVTPTIDGNNHSYGNIRINASKASEVYGRKNANGRDEANEIRPNSVSGIWIIRASGAFAAANSKFEVINAYNPMPAVGNSITGGFIQGSLNDDKGQTVNAVGMTVNNTVGGKPVGVFGVANWIKNPTTNAYVLSWKHMDLDWDSGYLTLPSGVYVKNNVVVTGNDYPTIRFQDSANTLLGSIYGEYRGSIKDPNNAQYRKDVTIATGGASPKYFVHGGDGSMTIPGRCDVSGDFTASRVFASGQLLGSDRELKDDIEPIADALGKIDHLSGYTYILKADGRKSAGVIAQELQEVLPDVVHPHPLHGHLTVEYSGVIALLVESVKALKAQNEDLQAQIAELKAKP